MRNVNRLRGLETQSSDVVTTAETRKKLADGLEQVTIKKLPRGNTQDIEKAGECLPKNSNFETETADKIKNIEEQEKKKDDENIKKEVDRINSLPQGEREIEILKMRVSSRRGRLTPVLSHHHTYRSVYGGS